MARRSKSPSQEEMETELEGKVNMSDDFPTTEELNKRKDQMIAKQNGKEHGRRATRELKTWESGKQIETDLIYNTKEGNMDCGSARKYRTSLCINHPNCLHGANCKFAHGEEQLKAYVDIQRLTNECYEQEKGTAKDHHELCQNQRCPVRLRLLLYKTVICTYWKDCVCNKPDCVYAHGNRELKPLPKYELCMNKTCNLKDTECVYAHDKSELRYKGAEKIYSSDPPEPGYESSGEVMPDISEISLADTGRSSYSDNQSASSKSGGERLCKPCGMLREIMPKEVSDQYFIFSRRSRDN